MIEFPCHHCGFQFSVPQDQAGGTIQCPTCHRLADIPTLSDLESILPDGTYLLDQPEPPPPDRLAKTFEAFDRSIYDAHGNEKDLRLTMHDIRRVGAPEPPPTPHPLQTSPKYDPETGQLLRPLDVARREQDADNIPLAKPAVGYATPGLADRISPGKVYLQLFTPGNAIVLSFIFLFHLLAQLMILIVSILFPVAGVAVLTVVIIAHYGCVIEDIGREEKDELPRPLRDLHLIEDFWWPFCNVVGSLFICYGPVMYARAQLNFEYRSSFFILGSLAMLGSILFPAVLITLITSGSVINLRPDRVLGVIQAAGRYYVLLALSWIVSLGTYMAGILAFNFVTTVGMLQWSGRVPKRYWALSIFLLMAGIYLIHAFCWQLGLLYREKHTQFPWAFQRHIRQTKREKLALAQRTRSSSPRRGAGL
jgi:hypothetical protein